MYRLQQELISTWVSLTTFYRGRHCQALTLISTWFCFTAKQNHVLIDAVSFAINWETLICRADYTALPCFSSYYLFQVHCCRLKLCLCNELPQAFTFHFSTTVQQSSRFKLTYSALHVPSAIAVTNRRTDRQTHVDSSYEQ